MRFASIYRSRGMGWRCSIEMVWEGVMERIISGAEEQGGYGKRGGWIKRVVGGKVGEERMSKIEVV